MFKFVQFNTNSVLWCLYNEALLFRNLFAMVIFKNYLQFEKKILKFTLLTETLNSEFSLALPL